MKKIKFRGKSLKTGEFVYGGAIQNEKQFMITNLDFDEEGYPYPNFTDVEPESVAQLIGYDKNGKEIYSDDKVNVDDGYRIYACWIGYEQMGDTFENWTVREVTDNGVE